MSKKAMSKKEFPGKNMMQSRKASIIQKRQPARIEAVMIWPGAGKAAFFPDSIFPASFFISIIAIYPGLIDLKCLQLSYHFPDGFPRANDEMMKMV